MPLRLPLSILSPSGPRARLSILIFHRVLAQPDPLFPELPDAIAFEERMRWVREWFHVLPLARAVEQLYAGTLPSRALSITFDDGYADNVELAAPILRRLGLTASFFIATGYLGGGCMWNDRVIEAIRGFAGPEIDLTRLGLARHALGTHEERARAIGKLLGSIKHLEAAQRQSMTDRIVEAAGAGAPPALMMQPRQLRRLREMGMSVGAHTVTHPILSRLPEDAAFAEMRDSRRVLEDILREPVRLFAYPNGVPGDDYDAQHVRMARECGFSAAVSTAWGAASARSDRFQLPRFSPWDSTRLRYGVRLLANFTQTERVAA